MPLVLLTGPEKAGKTTLARELLRQWDRDHPGLEGYYRHWSAISHDEEYAQALMEDRTRVQEGQLVIWDRGWPCEYVYSTLLPDTLDTGRNQLRSMSRLRTDPWLGEWLYGRAFDMKIVVTRPTDRLIADRDSTDLPCDPEQERNLYIEYGRRFGYLQVNGSQTPQESAYGLLNNWNRELSRRILSETEQTHYPEYVGPRVPVVTVVGEGLSSKPGFRGAYLPFTSRLTIPMGRIIGDKAFELGWTNIGTPVHAPIILACGVAAAEWAYYQYKDTDKTILYVPHPSYVYRYNGNQAVQKKELLETTVRWIRDSVIGNPDFQEDVDQQIAAGTITPYEPYIVRRRRAIEERQTTGSNQTGVITHG